MGDRGRWAGVVRVIKPGKRCCIWVRLRQDLAFPIMNENETFQVYIKPGCPWCVDVIAYLKKGGYDFNEIDVTSDPAAFAKMAEIFGQTSAPSMTVGELLLADFGVEELVPFLEEHGLLRP